MLICRKIVQKCIQHNEGKSVVAERSIRTLKNKIYKYITSVSKNIYSDKLDKINSTIYIIEQLK